MTIKQCMKCKNTNPLCRESFVLYYSALCTITEAVNDGNRDSRYFQKDNARRYDFVDITCSHFEPKGEE